MPFRNVICFCEMALHERKKPFFNHAFSSYVLSTDVTNVYLYMYATVAFIPLLNSNSKKTFLSFYLLLLKKSILQICKILGVYKPNILNKEKRMSMS